MSELLHDEDVQYFVPSIIQFEISILKGICIRRVEHFANTP